MASSSSSELFEIGFISTNIACVRYYSGTVSARERVRLVREPRNHYDKNAIQVYNTRDDQVGLIEFLVAAVLSPLIDQRLIKIECIVPMGDTNNTTGFCMVNIPCQIHVYARIEDFEQVFSAIYRGGVCFISSSEPGFRLESEAAVGSKGLEMERRSLDEIFMLAEENVTKNGVAFEAIEPPKSVILTELFPHQKQGLGWLVHKENSDELPPFLEEVDAGVYVNALSSFEMHTRPGPLRGGIFADDMGMGKTLTLLSLIALDKYSETDGVDVIDEVIDEEHEADGGKRKRKWKTISSSSKLDNAHLDSKMEGKSVNSVGRKTTLIVFPPSVFSTWISHLEDHTKIGSLKVYMFYGDKKKGDAEVLNKYDIVLTTYSTLASEVSKTNSPFKNFEWWRVILDDAHVIKNVKSNMSKAVTNLKTSRRWVVTGTPIQNGTFDLFPLMAFLHFEPFSKKNYWYSLISQPLSRGEECGIVRMQALMASISLRRTKENALIGLPSKSIEMCFVDLSQEERELYQGLEEEAKTAVRSFVNAGSLVYNYSTVIAMILRLRQVCTNVALCPSDLVSFFSSGNIADVSNNPDLLKKIVSAIQDEEDFDCPICISPPTEFVITCCAHIFCRDCILKTLKHTKPCCPLCRRSLTQSDLFTAPQPQETDKTEMTSSVKSSSKVSALIKILSSTRDENPNIKSVVFSQFQKMLVLLEEPLRSAGFQTLRLDGTMNAQRRAQVIKEFGVDSRGPTILLATLKTSSAGINLTAASRVYFVEPCWNPAVEEQAMERVHRIGQTQDVKIVRFIVRYSIEERVFMLQDKKRRLAREAFRKKGAKDKEVSIDDLRFLMAM